VLSVFANMLWVSVYTVHMSVIGGIKSFANSMASGFDPAIGDMIARGEKETLNKTVDTFEFLSFFFVSILFTITGIMIVPFVKLYTKGITDINYIQPLFAILMCISEGIYVIRSVYSSVVYAAGHFKQTNKGAYIEAIINITTSVALVYKFGIVGVAIGTCIAMIYRTIDYVIYLYKNILYRSPLIMLKRLLINSAAIVTSVLFCNLFIIEDISDWGIWIVKAMFVSMVVVICVSAINVLFYRTEFLSFTKRMIRK